MVWRAEGSVSPEGCLLYAKPENIRPSKQNHSCCDLVAFHFVNASCEIDPDLLLIGGGASGILPRDLLGQALFLSSIMLVVAGSLNSV